MAPHVAFPPWAGLLPSSLASSGPLPPHWPSLPAWSEPGPPTAAWAPCSLRLGPGLPFSVCSWVRHLFCALTSGLPCHGEPHVCLRGLCAERLPDNQTVISEHKSRVCFPARLCWGPRTAPRFWDSSSTATIPDSARVWGAQAKEKGPEGPRRKLPGVLSLWSHWRRLTPEPRAGPGSQELVRNATPGTSLGFPSRAGDAGRSLVREARPHMAWATKPVCCQTQHSQSQNTASERRQAWGLCWELLP